ncbi:dihydrodipicolinate reductase [Pseudopedobacter saltans DSM 12145]|uniref:4-hydroxy-tetrahydrodipicolinate reductase n=1 Tax=Pseudopedobacter saltans (strain ATCC 51119 / DSM 12145 / JCM 21818 / CCUG 39354 / LMG 10337 / NBRC 100064 / NCIMB 13643) TaxID=762903 RepID=F0SEH8_PSESL|nr:4-hydroxy-tetrahydrodipicolinate reductase [Pseudopedobacter saltans]ADY50843.1 dihydrodipicolinate reductase [Pseudopedobacter saltans DSM 12145]
MKIALLGYGKMGKMIEGIALDRNHEIVLKIDENNTHELTIENLRKADVAIEFSTPHTVLDNIYKCIESKTPLVVGTTGWYGHLQQVKDACVEANSSVMYGSNFSVGVNIFFQISKMAAKMMNNFSDQYDVCMEEIHHIHKLDSPSGTAITIAEDILEEFKEKRQWVDVNAENSDDVTLHKPENLIINSFREGEVPGTHVVLYDSDVDRIELKHVAHGRQGFALGAVLAAEWLPGKAGFYSVKEMYDFKV